MSAISPGMTVYVETADGSRLQRKALSGPVDGDDFRVVIVCKPEDWPSDGVTVSHELTMAWPVEYVYIE